jgi:hypothetical protein
MTASTTPAAMTSPPGTRPLGDGSIVRNIGTLPVLMRLYTVRRGVENLFQTHDHVIGLQEVLPSLDVDR